MAEMNHPRAKRIISVCLAVIAVIVCCVWASRAFSGPVRITYSLYPYLRNMEELRAEVEAAWKEKDPSVELVYAD